VEGLSDDDNAAVVGTRIVPPDVNGDIGLDGAGNRIYIQYINLIWAVYDVNGALIAGPFAGNSFWQGFGGFCQSNNDGDPVVLYDDEAGQWFFSQFSVNQGIQCVAVSATSDPMGPYHRYAFTVTPGGANDYPKLGVWDDGTSGSTGQSAYTFTLRDFGGAGGGFSVSAGVMERDAMLVGGPAQFIKFINPCTAADCIEGQLPPHQAGPVPPAGTCPTFFTAVDAAYDDSPFGQDGYRNHTLCVDWSNTDNSTYTEGPLVVAGSDFDRFLGNGFSDCISPVNGGEVLDCLAAFTMFRAQYRWFGNEARVVFNTTVDAGSDRAGIRWAEVTSADGDSGWALGQDGTYAPADGLERWMGSIAQDGDGNIALGYSVAGTNLMPAVRYTTRTAGDAPGTMPGGEISCYEGNGAQVSSANRWGDYSSMSVDPTDDCTFWYTQEYYEVTNSFDFETRICSFKMAGCGGPPNDAPVVTITAPADGSSFGQGVNINFTGTATDTEDGVISGSIAWSSNLDGSLGSGASINVNDLSASTHTITAQVTDSGGASDSDQISVTVNAPPATTMHVASIVPGTQAAGKGKKNGTATVTIHDTNHNSAGAGITVTGDFSGSFTETGASDDTDGSGVAFVVTFESKKKVGAPGFCVSDVTGGSLSYESGDNHGPDLACDEPPPAGDEVLVDSVSTGSTGVGGGSKAGTATITIKDDNGNPAVGYTVTGDFGGDFSEPGRTGVTGGDGSVTIQTNGSKKGKVNVTFCVSNVSGPLPYNGGNTCP
jgi:hypothetical protein